MEEKKVLPIKQITTHIKPHIDEGAAIFLLKLFGQTVFPGINKAKVVFLANRQISDDDDFLKSGVVFVGMGKGMFDEHGKKDDETAATLVAKYLGIADDHRVKPLLHYTINVDTNANGHPFDLANMLKDFFQTSKNTEEEMGAFNWAMDAIKTKFNHPEKISDFTNFQKCINQLGDEIKEKHCEHIKKYAELIMKKSDLRPFGLAVITEVMCREDFNKGLKWFFYALEIKISDREKYLKAMKEFLASAQRHIVECGKRQMKVAIIKSKNHKMNKVFRDPGVGNYDILIQESSSGNIAIYTNAKSHVKMDVVTEIIRSIELSMDGKKIAEDYKYLQSDGVIKEVPQWYYLKRGNMLLNGSLTAKQPPTRLSSNEVLEIISIAFNPRFLPEKCFRSKKCDLKHCIFYALHMNRCYNFRKENRKKGKVIPFPSTRKAAKTGSD